MTVFLDGFEVLCVDVLVAVFKQGTLQSIFCVPGVRPRLQVLLYGLGDALVMRRHNLGTVVPIHLRQRQSKKERCDSRLNSEELMNQQQQQVNQCRICKEG